jgi:hypothetical protein
MKVISLVALLCCALLPGSAFAEGQALSANGGTSGSEPAAIGAGNKAPDAPTSWTPVPATSGTGKPPVDGAADQPKQ